MRRSDEDSIGWDPIHKYTSSRFDVVHVNVAIFCNEIYDVVFGGDLHRYREIVLGFGREENVHSLLWERLVTGRCLANLCQENINYSLNIYTPSIKHIRIYKFVSAVYTELIKNCNDR